MASPNFGPTGGLSQFVMTTTSGTNTTLVKAGATELMFFVMGNINANPRFVKFFDMPTAPTALGNDPAATPVTSTAPPVGQAIIPGNTNGAGSNGSPGVSVPYASLQFNQGLVIAITNDMALASNSGVSVGDCTIWLGYK